MASNMGGIHKAATLLRAQGAISASLAEYGSPPTFQGHFCRGGARISPCGAQSRREYRCSPAHLGLHRKQLATLEGASEFLSSLPLAHRANLRSALKKLAKSEEKRGRNKRGAISVAMAILYVAMAIETVSVAMVSLSIDVAAGFSLLEVEKPSWKQLRLRKFQQ